MRAYQIPTLIRMLTDTRVCRFLHGLHRELARDPGYSPIKLIRAFAGLIGDSKIMRFHNRYVLSSFMPPLPSVAFGRMLRATPSGSARFGDLVRSNRTAPVSTHISVTSRCASSCIHCSASCASTRPGEDMPIATIRTLINDLQDMGTAMIGITGGEPLLRDDLEEIVAMIDNRSASVLYTSGVNLTQSRACKFKAAGLFAIAVSLDHHEPEACNRIRGNSDAYDSACAAAVMSREAGIYTLIQPAVHESTIESEIRGLAERARELGVHEIRFLERKASGRWRAEERPGDSGDAVSARCLRVQRDIAGRRGYPKITVLAHIESQSQLGCCGAALHSYVSVNGDLHPCDFVRRSFGNIGTGSIAQLWTNMRDELRGCGGACIGENPALSPGTLPGFFAALGPKA